MGVVDELFCSKEFHEGMGKILDDFAEKKTAPYRDALQKIADIAKGSHNAAAVRIVAIARKALGSK